jgi:hypothetical protein
MYLFARLASFAFPYPTPPTLEPAMSDQRPDLQLPPRTSLACEVGHEPQRTGLKHHENQFADPSIAPAPRRDEMQHRENHFPQPASAPGPRRAEVQHGESSFPGSRPTAGPPRTHVQHRENFPHPAAGSGGAAVQPPAELPPPDERPDGGSSFPHFPELVRLTDRQRTAVVLLVMGERVGKVAEKIGVARATVWRWRSRPRDRQR